MLMDSFIDSKNNLELFAQDVGKISEIIKRGVADYTASKEATAKVLDGK